jgi:hypothetical protein
MSYNGSGVFNINTAGQPVVTGTVISSTAFNALTADLATGLTTALTKDGQTTPTANIPMGGFKITGIAAATTLGDALSYGRAATVSTLTNSALTSGRVTFASTNGLLADNTNLFWDNTNNRLGIGTSSPTTIFQVNTGTPVITISSTGTTASSQDFTTNSAAGKTKIGVEQSTGGGLFVGSSAYAAVFGSVGASNTQFASNNNVRMTIDTSGNLGVGVTSPACILDISGASGGQIKFPAAQNASSDANTLDDYEEGTWTPAQGSGLTVVGAFSSAGRYTKIGSTAFLQGSVTGATSVACTNGGAITSNLPFTSTNTVVGIGGFVNAAGTVGGTTDCGPSSTSMAATPAIAATTTIYFSLTYQTT